MFKSILCYKHKENIKKKLRSLRNQDTLTPVKKISLIYRSRHGNELSQLFTCGCFFLNRSILKKKMIQKLHEYFTIYLFEHGLVSRYQAKAGQQTARQASTEIHLHVWNGSSVTPSLFCTRPC